MKGEEAPQNDVPFFLQHRQGHSAGIFLALSALALEGVARKNDTPEEPKKHKSGTHPHCAEFT